MDNDGDVMFESMAEDRLKELNQSGTDKFGPATTTHLININRVYFDEMNSERKITASVEVNKTMGDPDYPLN